MQGDVRGVDAEVVGRRVDAKAAGRGVGKEGVGRRMKGSWKNRKQYSHRACLNVSQLAPNCPCTPRLAMTCPCLAKF